MRILLYPMLVAGAVSLVCLGGLFPAVAADDPSLAKVKAVIDKIDEAASRCDVDGVISQYAPGFKSEDGLDVQASRRAFSSLCGRIDKPAYRTEVRSVKKLAKGGLSVTTTTNLTAGYRTDIAKPAQLIGTIESVNRFVEENGTLKLAGQSILSEQTTVTIGEKPPRVDLKLPTTLRPGKEFKVEAVLATPLQDAPALGGVNLEPIGAQTATGLSTPDLEPLRSGGIFKIGKAPARPGDQLLTLAFVRDGGLLLISQRLKVTAEPATRKSAAKDLVPGSDRP